MSFLNVTAMISGPIKRQTWNRIELTLFFCVCFFGGFFRAHFGVLGSNPSSATYSCVIVGKLFNFSKSQFLISNMDIILTATS